MAIDLSKICLGVDIWEGNPALDLPTLYANGVRFILIRLNDTVDYEHLDIQFVSRWQATKQFYRGLYFVFADWWDAVPQRDFIIANWPTDAPKVIFLDVELLYTTPATVGTRLYHLVQLLQAAGYKVIIYSGTWYWDNNHIVFTAEQLALMKTLDYWWARYPGTLKPSTLRKIWNKVKSLLGPTAIIPSMTWDQLKAKIAALTWQPWSYSPSEIPGPCSLWQCTSYYAYPGTGGCNVDVNLFQGDETALKAYLGGIEAEPPAPPDTDFTVTPLVDGQNIRLVPAGTSTGKYLYRDNIARPVLDIATVNNAGASLNGVWVKIDAGWIALQIQSTIYQTIKRI